MMSKLVSCFLGITFLFVACAAGETKKGKSVDYEVYVDQVIHQIAKEMKEEYSFRCIGDGGKMPQDIEEISVDFIDYKKATVEDARILEVNATEKFLKIINSHEKIRPFLREFPFKANRVKVYISFNKPDNTWYSDGSVAVVFQARDKLFFRQAQPITQDLLPLHEELYETALKIVQESPKKESPPGNS
jgi:hypothetical protein